MSKFEKLYESLNEAEEDPNKNRDLKNEGPNQFFDQIIDLLENDYNIKDIIEQKPFLDIVIKKLKKFTRG